jgi:hypothetical protein
MPQQRELLLDFLLPPALRLGNHGSAKHHKYSGQGFRIHGSPPELIDSRAFLPRRKSLKLSNTF